MTLIQAAVFGVVQGLTEFLPISSSAHLVLLPWFFGWQDPGLAFDVALHWGTLLGVVVFYWREILVLIQGFFNSLRGERGHHALLSWKIIVATIPAAIIGKLFEKQAEHAFRSPWITVGTLSIFGLILWLADRRHDNKKSLADLGWAAALFIGTVQSLAIVPGVSRSGATISTALFLGLTRSAAVEFSFLLSIPIIFGAGLMKIKYLLSNIHDPIFIMGVATSAVSGFLAVRLLVTFVRNRTFTPFVVYRLALAAFIVFWILK